MKVTINTDASFNSQLKIGAYAFWIVCDQGRIMKVAAFKEPVDNSTEAEVKCIINALYALNEANFTSVKSIIINTDCKHFSAYLQNRIKGKEAKMFDKISYILRLKFKIKGLGFINIRHVKSHCGTETKRQWVNDWCDKKAKEALQSIINSKP